MRIGREYNCQLWNAECFLPIDGIWDLQNFLLQGSSEISEPTCTRNLGQEKNAHTHIPTPWEVIPITAYAGRLCPKWVPLQVYESIGIHKLRYMNGYGNLSFRYNVNGNWITETCFFGLTFLLVMLDFLPKYCSLASFQGFRKGMQCS